MEYITYVNNPELDALYKTRIGDNIIVTRAYKTVSGQLKDETDIEYAHRDHLGSVESITDQNGTKLMQLAFEPFGARKKSNWRQNIDATELATIESSTFDYTIPNIRPRVARGFTGHEHLDKTGFIHMNGRVYDPVLGRFLSPDPIVQEPNNSQNWDRYAYVLNNPLNATDPSGYRRRMCFLRCFFRRTYDFIGYYMRRFRRAVYMTYRYYRNSRNRRPNFERMSNKNIVDWVVKNRKLLGINIRNGVSVIYQDDYIGSTEHGTTIDCEGNPECNGSDPVYGLLDGDSIFVFKHTVDGIGTISLPGKDGVLRTIGVRFNRVESIIHTIGHEGAHSVGIDVDGDPDDIHVNAEKAGYDAVIKFRRLYQ